ncbi:MAG: UDP-2,3-diacylglucosamine diphosphatase LpxI [Candidatus Sumerlaeia bacterium]
MPDKIGIIAGGGNFPLLVARAAAQNNVQVYVFGVEGLTSEHISRLADKTYWLNIGAIERLIALFRENGIRHAIMAGRIPHSVVIKNIMHFDGMARKILGSLINKKASTVLERVIQTFEDYQITVLDSSMFVKDCIPQPGLLTPNRPLTERERKDIEFGYPLAREIARLDVGQTLVVRDQVVIAVEGIDGTDATIRRGRQLIGPGTVVVKSSRPEQDLRYDIPTIGLDTIRVMIEAEASALAVTGCKSLFFDREEAVALAERHNIGIVALE